MGRNDAVVMDLALALFEQLKGQRVVVVTVQRKTVSMDSQMFESASAVEGKVRIKMDKSSFDAVPSLCRRLNPPMLASGVCEESVMVGYPADNDGLILYRILVCTKTVMGG